MLVGDFRKYLVILLTLKHELLKDMTYGPNLAPEVIAEFKSLGS